MNVTFHLKYTTLFIILQRGTFFGDIKQNLSQLGSNSFIQFICIIKSFDVGLIWTNITGLVLKEPFSLCGYPAFKTQVKNIVVILGTGMVTEDDLKGKEVNQYLKLSMTIGQSFVVTQVFSFCLH